MIQKRQINLLNSSSYGDAPARFMECFKLKKSKPDIVFLRQIVDSLSKLPYENLSKIIKLNKSWNSEDKIRLPEEVINDYISYKLGGTCFSLTFLLYAVLTCNNYKCYPAMADMLAGEIVHCVLIVIIDGAKYLVDPGYLFKKPIKLLPGKSFLFENPFAEVELKFDPNNQTYNFFTIINNEAKWRYKFQDKAASADEFLERWISSFHFNFMRRIYLTKAGKEEIIFVRDRFMRKTTSKGKENFNIKNRFSDVINDLFYIDKQIVDKARIALKENLEKERASGLWKPKDKS